jgi:peptidoglycan/xylan/chitin deacetylase (PgdA/CDA1 family)
MRRRLRALRCRALILVYHRIQEVNVDPWELAVQPEHFQEHLEVLKRRSRPLSLVELTRSIRNRRIPRRGVVITFDDGYADNLLNAKPMLERHGIPATVFVATGPLDTGESFWWDQLTDILLTPGRLPGTLRLEIESEVHEWDLEGSTEYTDADVRRDRRWRPWRSIRPTLRHELYVRLYHLLRPLSEPARRVVLMELRHWGGERTALESARPLSRREVTELCGHELVEIGAHTVTHSHLASLDHDGKAAEICRSREMLEQIVGRDVSSFAYPYGRSGDYDDQSVEIVRRCGFRVACASVPGPVTERSDTFELPRFHVSDCDGSVLEQRLDSWLASA